MGKIKGGKNRAPVKSLPAFLLRAFVPSCFVLFGLVRASTAGESVTLKYTDRPGSAQVTLLRDMKGDAYLPLAEVARFYGVRVDFDPQTRRVTLTKDQTQVKFALSQPLFMILPPAVSYPMDPVEEVSGQMGVPPGSAEDLLNAVLNLGSRYLADQRELLVGDITDGELKQEILAASRVPATPTPPPAAAPALATPEASEEDATGGPDADSQEAESLPPPGKSEEDEPTASQIYRVRRIVIDAGHGGVDSGARGYDRRYVEKQATLDIARRVAEIVKRQSPGLDVLMTRKADYYITLKYRTEFANRHGADLFVSIHCNSNPRPQASGTEVYVYGAKASNRMAAVAAVRENGSTDYKDFILADLHQSAYKERSYAVAEKVSRHIQERLGQHIRPVQRANFYVLARADMPSILVETAFISNRKEEKKLEDGKWRESIAKAIADGILDYRNLVERSIENKEARR